MSSVHIGGIFSSIQRSITVGGFAKKKKVGKNYPESISNPSNYPTQSITRSAFETFKALKLFGL
jgi:hypothetical protein